MSNNEEATIRPYKVQRVCEPQADIERLVLKQVDSTESVYTRMLLKLRDAALPTSQYASEFEGNTYPWDLFVALKYRQDWKPSGYGLGDLIYSVSLLPNEELTLEVKTWETSKTQQDEDVKLDSTQKSDIKSSQSVSAESTTEDQSKTKEYVDAKAGYSGFGFSCSVSAGWSQDVSTLNRNIAKQTQESSNQATNEYRATRQVKMAVSRETGSEAKTTRKIKNPNQYHTLNINYFQVLREFMVSLHLYDTAMVILGKAPLLDVPYSVGGLSETTTIKEMIEASQDASSVEAFVQKFGVSPVLTLRRLWSRVLWEGALVDRLPLQYPADEKDRNAFRNTMLQFVRPTPGWVEPDNAGELRWGYEILPDQLEACLKYLYQFVPYGLYQMVALLAVKGLGQEAALSGLLALEPGKRLTLEANVQLTDNKKILAAGPFQNITVKDFKEVKLPQWVAHIVDQYEKAQQQTGPVPVDGGQPYWKTTLPTQGVWADLGLGICSGGEDYYEIHRQFDLELKQLEVEKLKLEVEKLKLENQSLAQGKAPASFVIKNPTEKTAINLELCVPRSGAEVEIKSGT